MECLQRVMMNEDVPVEKITTVLVLQGDQPAISFHNSKLAPMAAQGMALSITVNICWKAVERCLVDMGASIDVLPPRTLELCDVPKEKWLPSIGHGLPQSRTRPCLSSRGRIPHSGNRPFS